MATQKTTRVYAFNLLDGTSLESTLESLSAVITNLSEDAANSHREVLFDTLNIRIIRESIDDSTFSGRHETSTLSTIKVSAEAVRRG